MTRLYFPRLRISGVRVPFVAVLTVLITVAVPAQQSATRQPSAKSSAVSVPLSATPAAQTTSSQLPRVGGAKRAPLRRVPKETRAGTAPAPLFLPVVTYSVPSEFGFYWGGAAGGESTVVDVNGDGRPDLLWSGAIANDGAFGVLLSNGDGTFKESTGPYDSGRQAATYFVVADLNNDGKPDVVVSESNCTNYCGVNHETVGVLLGNGDGTFQQAVVYDSGAFDGSESVAVGDLNADGKPDLVVANLHCKASSFEGCVGVLLGNGDGTFQPAQVYDAAGSNSQRIVLADVNGDGKLDVLVTNGGAGDVVSVLLGDGDGTFQPAVPYGSGGYFPLYVVVADVNGDSKPDVVVANVYSDTIAVLLGNGNGTFRPAVAYSSGGKGILSMVVADVNGDGHLDLLTANCGAAWGFCPGNDGAVVGVLLGNGDGTFQPAETYSFGVAPSGLSGESPQQVIVSDVNGDGIPDLLGTRINSGWIAVLLGNGDGTFQQPLNYDSGTYMEGKIVVGDFNGDGRPDLAVVGDAANWAAGFIGVLLNSGDSGQISTATALTSSPNPSVYGQIVTFTTHVTANAGTPTGTVQILNGATVVGSGTLANGSISIPVSTLPKGSDSITASYLGGGGFAPSKSAPLTQTVTVATTTTSLTSSLNPAGTNQTITFTAKVTSQYGGAGSGTVAFMAGSQNLGSASLAGNIATLTTSFATAGTYSITAQYAGDSNNTGSISAALSEKVITSTTTALVSSLNPSVVGQAVTFTATVSSSAGVPPNGEIITFKNGSTVLGTSPLGGGMASLTTSSLSAGTYTITASYPGDSKFAASTSPGLRQVVNSTTKSATSTTLASSLNPSIYGQKVTWTATVTTTGPVPPTGTVVFSWSDGFRKFNIGSAILNSSGVAVLIRSNLNADPYPLTATYQGDANNLTSTSPILNQTVLQATSTATITSLPNPSTVGQAVTFTATITSPTVTPTGPVTFTTGKTVLGTAQLSRGEATLTISSLPAGSSVVTVTFAGDSNIAKSLASVTQVVD